MTPLKVRQATASDRLALLKLLEPVAARYSDRLLADSMLSVIDDAVDQGGEVFVAVGPTGEVVGMTCVSCRPNPIDDAIVASEFAGAIAPLADLVAVRAALLGYVAAWAAAQGARGLMIQEVAGSCLGLYDDLGFELAEPRYTKAITSGFQPEHSHSSRSASS